MRLYENIMNHQETIALATSMENNPNVRIVNFIHFKEKPNCLYFATFRGNQKEVEFKNNSTVAFTSIPTDSASHVKVKEAQLIKSNSNIKDFADDFINKIPDYKEILDNAIDQLNLYEIHFKTAIVIEDFMKIHQLKF